MRNILLTAATTLLFTGAALSQEAGVFTHYHLNPVLLNPGATGFGGQHEFLFNYRNRWAAFDGSPRTYTFNYNGPVADRMGLGGQLLTETIGKLRTFQATVSYAYRLSVDQLDLGIGLSTGFQQLRLASVSDDPFIDTSDELLNEALDGVTLFDASFGLYGEVDERLLFGVSFPNLVRTRLAEVTGDTTDQNEEFNYAFLVGYRFHVASHDFFVEPSIAVKNIRRVPFQVDLNLKLSFLEEQLIGGITYSLSEDEQHGFGVLLGTRVDRLYFFYSYDIGFGEFQDFNNGSHELTIQYKLPARATEAAPE